jgi:hypothetical protein
VISSAFLLTKAVNLMLDDDNAAFQALREANPVTDTEVLALGARSDRDQAQLLGILGGSSQPAATVVSLADRRTRKLRSLGAATLTGVALLSTVAWVVIHRKDSIDPVTVVCLTQARTFEMPTIEANPLQAAVIELKDDPINTCSEAWTRPWFEQPAQQPPALVACVLPAGLLAVMPGASPQDCEKIGLLAWSGKLRDDPVPLKAMSEELRRWIENHRCSQPAEAATAAQAALDHANLSKWKVQQDGATTVPSECGGLGYLSVGIDFSSRVITVTGDKRG